MESGPAQTVSLLGLFQIQTNIALAEEEYGPFLLPLQNEFPTFGNNFLRIPGNAIGISTICIV